MNMDTEIWSWGGGLWKFPPPVRFWDLGGPFWWARSLLILRHWKIVVKKYLFFAKLQPVEVGGEAKIHWFWCIFTKGIIRENPLPQLRPPRFSSWRVGFFLIFFWSKVSISILSFMHQEGCQSSQKRVAQGKVHYPPPPQDSISVSMFIFWSFFFVDFSKKNQKNASFFLKNI